MFSLWLATIRSNTSIVWRNTISTKMSTIKFIQVARTTEYLNFSVIVKSAFKFWIYSDKHLHWQLWYYAHCQQSYTLSRYTVYHFSSSDQVSSTIWPNKEVYVICSKWFWGTAINQLLVTLKGHSQAHLALTSNIEK